MELGASQRGCGHSAGTATRVATAPGTRPRVTRTSRRPPCGHAGRRPRQHIRNTRWPVSFPAPQQAPTHSQGPSRVQDPRAMWPPHPLPAQEATPQPGGRGPQGSGGCGEEEAVGWGRGGGGGHRGRLRRGCDIAGSCRLTGGQAAGQRTLWPLEGRPGEPRGRHAARSTGLNVGDPTEPRLPGQREGHSRDGASSERQGRSRAHSGHCRSGRGCGELQVPSAGFCLMRTAPKQNQEWPHRARTGPGRRRCQRMRSPSTNVPLAASARLRQPRASGVQTWRWTRSTEGARTSCRGEGRPGSTQPEEQTRSRAPEH